MEDDQTSQDDDALASAQRLRISRVLRGSLSFGCTAAIVGACWAWNFLDGIRAVHYVLAVVAINGIALATIATGANLRLKDPSLTTPLVLGCLPPSLYVMFFVTEPMVRAAFLLMGTVAILFGALALDRRHLMRVSAVFLLSYLALLAALANVAPERVDLRGESLVAVAYCIVLLQTASLGTFIAGLRFKLRQKNQSLEEAMTELTDLATRDPLTRLPNRRTAMAQLERELSRLERRRQDGDGLCLGLLDVDHFKRINDRYGHQTGDAVLRRIGDALQQSLRQGDFIARFGGEEFLIIMPETCLDGGVTAADRMRVAVTQLPAQSLGLPEVPTVSIGLAAHRPDERIEDTLACADQALYRAKHLGRNRVETSSGDSDPREATGA